MSGAAVGAADVVTVAVTAQVVQTQGTAADSFAVGEPLTLVYTFDPMTDDQFPENPNFGQYYGISMEASNADGSFVAQADSVYIVIGDDQPGEFDPEVDQYELVSYTWATDSEFTVTYGALFLQDLSATALSSDALPPAAPALADYDVGGIINLSSLFGSVDALITDISEVTPPPNQAPVAHAGPDQTLEAIFPGVATTLDGSASVDPDGDSLAYSWTTQVQMSGGATATPTVSFTELGTYAFDLIVSDGALSAEDQVMVHVVDSGSPNATATLITLTAKRRSATVEVGATCADAWDQAPTMSADINGVTVSDGQVLDLKEGASQKVTVRKGKTIITAPSFTLSVECADESGNASADTFDY